MTKSAQIRGKGTSKFRLYNFLAEKNIKIYKKHDRIATHCSPYPRENYSRVLNTP